MCTQVPIDITGTASQHTLVQLLGKNQVISPCGQCTGIVGRRVLRHPDLLAILGSKGGGRLHILQGQMAVEVTCHDVNLLAALLVLHQRVDIVLSKAQGLTADQTYTLIGLTIQ